MIANPLSRALAGVLTRVWWSPRRDALAGLLLPLSGLYAAVTAVRRMAYRIGVVSPYRAPVPVVVVGNLIVGGAGKTPSVIAIVQWLLRHGHHPGVISRGFGRDSDAPARVTAGSRPADVGDEPLLIHLRTGVPVMVARARSAAAKALLAEDERIDVLVADDGLQHLALARDVEVVVFDRRGAGNGLLLPAGPLREGLSTLTESRAAIVLYNADQPSTPRAGHVARRALQGACTLQNWRAGAPGRMDSLRELRGRRILAAAGIAEPERFFAMLEAEGLTIERLPVPDHDPLTPVPWASHEADVIVTEKDAVKLDPATLGATRVWVVGLDFQPPEAFFAALQSRLNALPR